MKNYMLKMKSMTKNYITEETAAEDIKTIMFVVVGIVAVVAIGWFVWNLLSTWSAKGNDASDSADHKQNDPFGSTNGPFGG